MSIFSKLSKIEVKLSQITRMNLQIRIKETMIKTLRTITTMNVKLDMDDIVEDNKSID